MCCEEREDAGSIESVPAQEMNQLSFVQNSEMCLSVRSEKLNGANASVNGSESRLPKFFGRGYLGSGNFYTLHKITSLNSLSGVLPRCPGHFPEVGWIHLHQPASN